MRLDDAFDLVATVRPAWKDGGSTWVPPHSFNREHALRLLGANKNVKKIKKADLAQMRTKLLNEHGQNGKRSPGGINRIMSMVNCLLRELVELEVLEAAPKLRSLPENNMKSEYYTKDDVSRMVEAASVIFDRPDLGEVIDFAVRTGCRMSEILNLRVRDIDLERGQLRIPDTKNGTEHILDIHRELYSFLERRCGSTRNGDALVFYEFAGSRDKLRYEFYKVRDYIGKDRRHNFHTLRHSCGTWLAEAGVPIQTIAKVLNHKQILTSARYAKVTDKARKSAIDLL